MLQWQTILSILVLPHVSTQTRSEICIQKPNSIKMTFVYDYDKIIVLLKIMFCKKYIKVFVIYKKNINKIIKDRFFIKKL